MICFSMLYVQDDRCSPSEKLMNWHLYVFEVVGDREEDFGYMVVSVYEENGCGSDPGC